MTINILFINRVLNIFIFQTFSISRIKLPQTYTMKMHKITFLRADLLRLHKLIKNRATGTPKQLARKLGCSESSVYNKLNQLKEMGLPIVYCSHTGYYYTGDVKVNFSVSVDDIVLKRIVGGQGHLTNIWQNNFATPKNLE